MSLTVPQAGVIAGRSADTAVNRPSELGAGLADLGQGMLQVGLKLKAERDDIDMKRTQLALTRDMGQARLEVEQIGDPAQIGPAWEAKKAELRQKYLQLDDKGQSTLDPQKAEAYGLVFDDLDTKHALALSEKSINLMRSQREADWIEARQQIELDATTADPDTLQAMLDLGAEAIDKRAAQGLITPEQAATEKQAFTKGIYKNRANARIEADPAGFLAEAETGAWDSLGADDLSRGRLTAQAELNRREAEATKEAERQTSQMDSAIKSRFTTMTGMAKDGYKAADEEWLSSPAVQTRIAANPELAAAAAELDAARALRDELPGLRQMNPAQLAAEIRKEEAKPVTQPYQTERLKVLRTWHAEAEKNWATNKVDAAKAAGMAVPDLPEFDPTNPAPYAEGVASRIAYDASLKAQGYGNAPGVFAAAEKAQIDTIIDPKADMAPKLALAEAMAQATRGKPETVLRGLSADPAFNHATMMLAVTRDRDLAGQILQGAQKQALGTVTLPAETQMLLDFDEITGGIYEDNPKAKAQIVAAARAYYANGAAGLNPEGADSKIPYMDDTAARDAFAVAVRRVTGATPDANGELTVGGVQDVRGMMTVLPPGVPVRAVEATLDTLDDDLTGTRRNYGSLRMPATETEFPPKDDRLARFRLASLDGSTPDLGADPSAWFRQTYLVQVQGDVYELHYSVNGRSTPVRRADGDKAGAAWRFKLTDLIREGQR